MSHDLTHAEVRDLWYFADRLERRHSDDRTIREDRVVKTVNRIVKEHKNAPCDECVLPEE